MLYETYTVAEINRTDLISLSKGECKAIIDLTNSTMFDPKKNEWVKIPTGKEYRG